MLGFVYRESCELSEWHTYATVVVGFCLRLVVRHNFQMIRSSQKMNSGCSDTSANGHVRSQEMSPALHMNVATLRSGLNSKCWSLGNNTQIISSLSATLNDFKAPLIHEIPIDFVLILLEFKTTFYRR